MRFQEKTGEPEVNPTHRFMEDFDWTAAKSEPLGETREPQRATAQAFDDPGEPEK